MAEEVPVNRFCLLGTLDEAIAFAERCAREEPEPGPFYVLEVLRAADAPSRRLGDYSRSSAAFNPYSTDLITSRDSVPMWRVNLPRSSVVT
jgi:hypothetical protein